MTEACSILPRTFAYPVGKITTAVPLLEWYMPSSSNRGPTKS